MSPFPGEAAYVVNVDWEPGTGFGGTYDDITGDVLSSPGIRVERGLDTARASGTAMVPTADWTVINDDSRYSNSNATSPLVDLVLPGRPTQVSATFGDPTVLTDDAHALTNDPNVLVGGQDTVYLHTGPLQTPREHPAWKDRTVEMASHGRMTYLRSRVITTGVQLNITVGTAVLTALAAAGIPSPEYLVDPEVIANGRNLSYWYADNRNAFDVIEELRQTEGYPAAFYERGDGRIVFEGHSFRTLNDRSRYDRFTVADDDSVHGNLLPTEIAFESGLDRIINRASVDVTVRAAAALGQVWSFGDTITLDASGAATVTAKPSDPFIGAVTPVVVTDFTLSAGTVTVSLSQSTGASTVISFTGGLGFQTITGLRLRAQALTKVDEVRAESSVDASVSQNILRYGVHDPPARLSVWPGLSPAEARGLCDALVTNFQEPMSVVRFVLLNIDITHLQAMLSLEVSDRVLVRNAHAGLDLSVAVSQITHQIEGTYGLHAATFSCEEMLTQDPLIWDEGRWDQQRWGQ